MAIEARQVETLIQQLVPVLRDVTLDELNLREQADGLLRQAQAQYINLLRAQESLKALDDQGGLGAEPIFARRRDDLAKEIVEVRTYCEFELIPDLSRLLARIQSETGSRTEPRHDAVIPRSGEGIAGAPRAARATEAFYSYAHEDAELREELDKHLSLLERSGLIQEWHDRKIVAGATWAGEIDDRLRRANIVLLLISADFLASDYCFEIEMRVALERHAAGEARVIPVILRPCDWHGAPFSHLQCLPTGGLPVTAWASRDAAFQDVATGIRRVIEEMDRRRDRPATGAGPRLPPRDARGDLAERLAALIPKESNGRPGEATLPAAPVTVDGAAAAPARATYSEFGHGLLVLAELLEDSLIRERCVPFRSTFQSVSDKVGIVSDYKTLHDLLHTLQFQCYDLLVNDLRRFPGDLGAEDSLLNHESTLQKILDELSQVTGTASENADQERWTRTLGEAHDALREGINQIDPKLVRKAEAKMNQVLSIQPANINRLLVSAARDLPLGALSDAEDAICGALQGTAIEHAKLDSLRAEVDVLRKRAERLLLLVAEHDEWQGLDAEFRRIIAQSRGESDLLIMDLEVSAQDLRERAAAAARNKREWATQLQEDSDRLEDAVRRQEAEGVKRHFRTFRRRAGERFYAADVELKRFCECLRRLREPLNFLLARIA